MVLLSPFNSGERAEWRLCVQSVKYVDSHGQSEAAFAFSYLVRFNLLPRLKAVASQKLDNKPDDYPNLEHMRDSAWEALSAGDSRSEARTKKALRLQP